MNIVVKSPKLEILRQTRDVHTLADLQKCLKPFRKQDTWAIIRKINNKV
jgi:hypothetical protein